MKNIKTNKVEMFTDELHLQIFPFQPALSTRSNGGGKPVSGTTTIKVSGYGKNKIGIRR